MKIVKLVLLMMVLGLSTIISAQETQEIEVIKIATFLPTGAEWQAERDIGKGMDFAINFAVDRINSNGGVKGKKLVIVNKDTKCDAKSATMAATGLAAEGVKYTVGFLCSRAFIPNMDTFDKNDIISLVFGTSNTITNKLNAKKRHYNVLRLIPNDEQQMKIIIDDIVSKHKSKKIAVVSLDDTFGKSASSHFISTAKTHNLQVVLTEEIMSNRLLFKPAITKIKDSGAEVVYYIGYAEDAEVFFETLSKEVPNLIKYGTESIGDFQQQLDIFYPTVPDVSNNSLNGALTKALNDGKYSKNYSVYGAYAAINLLASAIESAASDDINDIVSELHTKKFDTGLGEISFDENGDIIGVNYQLMRK